MKLDMRITVWITTALFILSGIDFLFGYWQTGAGEAMFAMAGLVLIIVHPFPRPETDAEERQEENGE